MPVTLRESQEEAIEVELDGRTFNVTALTRSQHKLLEEAEKALSGAEETDDVVKAILGIVDVLVRPTGTQRKTAGEVLLAMWEADKVSINQITGLLEDLREAAEGRPT